MSRRNELWQAVRFGIGVVAAATFLIPLYYLLTVSLKTTSMAYTAPSTFPTQPDWQTYATAFKGAGGGIGMGKAIFNSVVITMFSDLLLIFIGSLSAFVLARRISKLSNFAYLVFVVGIILPSQLGIVPVYVVLRDAHLVGTYLGMIMLNTAMLMPLAVFLYTGFARKLPAAYEEAAVLDGAGVWVIYRRVVFPQLAPITGMVAVLCSLFIWNDLFDQLVFLSGTGTATVPVAIYSLAFANVSEYNVVFASVVISILPVVLLFLVSQRKVMQSFGGGLVG